MVVPLILASASPRRRELLAGLGLSFRVIAADIDEDGTESRSPGSLVEELAMKKALAVAKVLDQGLVIGADTLVIFKQRVLGKPKDFDQARDMLRLLEGTKHEVLTGVAVVDAATGKAAVGHERTVVFFRHLDEDEIETYVASGEPWDKAGGYAIQGLASLFVTRIEGCYSNVVGLPLARLGELCKVFDYDILVHSVEGGTKEADGG